MGEIGLAAQEVVAALNEAMQDWDPYVGKAAAKALKKIRDGKTMEGKAD